MSAALVVMEDNRHSSTYTEAENLARNIISRMDSMTAKLKNLEDDIRKLWAEFDKLKAGETILGCATKKEFCERKLNRTPRAIRYMLAGGNPDNQREEIISPAPAPPISPNFATKDQRKEYRQDFRKAHPEYANKSNAEVDAAIYPPEPEPKEIPLEDAIADFARKHGATLDQVGTIAKQKFEEYSNPTPLQPAKSSPTQLFVRTPRHPHSQENEVREWVSQKCPLVSALLQGSIYAVQARSAFPDSPSCFDLQLRSITKKQVQAVCALIQKMGGSSTERTNYLRPTSTKKSKPARRKVRR